MCERHWQGSSRQERRRLEEDPRPARSEMDFYVENNDTPWLKWFIQFCTLPIDFDVLGLSLTVVTHSNCYLVQLYLLFLFKSLYVFMFGIRPSLYHILTLTFSSFFLPLDLPFSTLHLSPCRVVNHPRQDSLFNWYLWIGTRRPTEQNFFIMWTLVFFIDIMALIILRTLLASVFVWFFDILVLALDWLWYCTVHFICAYHVLAYFTDHIASAFLINFLINFLMYFVFCILRFSYPLLALLFNWHLYDAAYI